MVIDLSNVIKVEGSKVSFNEKIEIGSVEFSGDTYIFTVPIHVEGTISNVGGSVLGLKALISGQLTVNCYRCTKPVQKDFSFNMDETLTNMDDSGIEEAIYFEGHRIDISDAIINNLLMNISMKYLCSEDCKGLCPTCGADLNTQECKCKNEAIDPRFEVLKQLLNEDK